VSDFILALADAVDALTSQQIDQLSASLEAVRKAKGNNFSTSCLF